MIEGKTGEDPKIVASRKISSYLYESDDGHLRRLWDEATIRKLVERHGLRLVEINKTTEVWRNIEAKFISFIAQK